MPTTHSTTDMQHQPRHDRKILVVDDEPDVLESTALLIESLGYQAIRLDDAGRILETVERERPALLLQDVRMKDLNLAGLVATLRSNPETAEVPLVFFSAHEDLAGTAARYDAWGYLSKPFGRAELARLLDRVLGSAEEELSSGRKVQRDVRKIFHDQWNLLAAISNYTEILQKAKGLTADEERCIRGLYETLLKLEAKTDRLRSYVTSVVDSLEGFAEERPPRRKQR